MIFLCSWYIITIAQSMNIIEYIGRKKDNITQSILYTYIRYICFLCLKGTSAEGDFLLCGNGDLGVLEYRGVEDGRERRGIGWRDVGGWSLLPVAACVVVYCCCFSSCGLYSKCCQVRGGCVLFWLSDPYFYILDFYLV